ncbi:MAG: DUF1116 domain-containing protein [bacterium]|nr:DUF1116 domain-containing protein [Candidatus Sumerlaeota bacterium]
MSTTKSHRLFGEELIVVNMGLASFGENLRREGATVVQMDWRPEAGGKPELLAALDRLRASDGELRQEIAKANEEAVGRLLQARPVIAGIGRAGDVIPDMRSDHVLHAGPPVTWERMCGPMRGAIIGGLIYEGLASNADEASLLAASGEIAFEPCHHHQAVGPMAGIITASMPVWIIENTAFGNRACSTLNEGLGKVLRYGAYSGEVIKRLRWMERTLAPVIADAIALHGPVDLRVIIAQALQMGDELHNRNRAATSLLIRELAPCLARAKADSETKAEVLEFMNGNDHFFLNLSMAACKSALDPTLGIAHSTMISAMARNGTEFGIRVSGLGNRWFTAPSPMVEGLYLPGFSEADAAPDIGDSVITETAGLGGFAMAAAPAIVQFVGGSASRALAFTREMYEITLAENPAYRIPSLDFRGTPAGIELTAVVASGIAPVVNTGIAHREPGIGMVGAGLVKPPISCFEQALTAFSEQYCHDHTNDMKEDNAR